MHQPNTVRLQLFVKCSHFLPEDMAAFLLKHLNSLLFSTKVKSCNGYNWREILNIEGFIRRKHTLHRPHSNYNLQRKKQKNDEDLGVRPNIYLYLQFTTLGMRRVLGLSTNVKPLFYVTTIVTAIVHNEPEGVHESVRSYSRRLHQPSTWRREGNFLQIILRSHTTMIAFAVS